MIVPVMAFAALATTLLYALTGGKKAFVSQSQATPPKTTMAGSLEALPPDATGSNALVSSQLPLSPEATRLLSLLVLFARDKRYPAGQKQYLTPTTAIEAMRLARKLGLPATSMAIRKDAPLPAFESLPGRLVSVRESVVQMLRTGRA